MHVYYVCVWTFISFCLILYCYSFLHVGTYAHIIHGALICNSDFIEEAFVRCTFSNSKFLLPKTTERFPAAYCTVHL